VSRTRPRVAWVTNDLPPRSGGIQQFVGSLLERTADAATLVVGPAPPRTVADQGRPRRPSRDLEVLDPLARSFDTSGAWRTVRAPGPILPVPTTARRVADLVAAHRPDVVVIASLWPLGLLASSLRRASGARVLGLTHGAEAGMSRVPTRPLLRAITRDVDLITVISDHTAAAIGAALPGRHLERLAPGVDLQRFGRAANASGASMLRERWGIPVDAPLVGCVARLVPRKGQDVLLRAWAEVSRRHPAAHLVLVGEGPLRSRLERMSVHLPSAHVVGPVTWGELPAVYAALDVFAMPVRTRLAGLDVEGLGISFLEAQAAGAPVVAGRSGGAPETVTDPRVGSVVDGRDVGAVVDALDGWLADPDRRDAAGELGPELVVPWSWEAVAARFDDLVAGLAASPQVR
jgi:phosphatidylinositol alpha-1,6-mannosyltransferase